MIVELLVIFFIFLGLSVAIKQAPGGKWLLKQTKNTVLWPIKAGWKIIKTETKTIVKSFLCTHRKEILSFFFGAGIAAIVLDPVGFWWTLGVLLLVVAGLLLGLIFSTWRGAKADFWDWIVSRVQWIWQNYATQIRWSIAGAILLSILKLAS